MSSSWALSAMAGLVSALAISSCSCGAEVIPSCAAGTCPCLEQSECPPGYDCVDDVCVEHIELPDAGFDAGLGLKGFGELCGDNDECLSGYCIADLRGAFCTVLCQLGCPEGWSCRLVPDPRGGAAPVGLCVADRQLLCQPCIDDNQCNPSGGDLCLPQGSLTYCARDCTFEGCPVGYGCTALALDDGRLVRQCQPETATCECGDENQGQLRGCERASDLGLCSGQELCEPAGWSDCSAREPASETCNGVDDNCDGPIDEGLEERPCTVSEGPWSCDGTERCQGSQGWLCDAPTPEAEACDGRDNNCNSAIDEDFVDDQGIYQTRAHCGGCGIDCDQLLFAATATACQVDATGARCVATACEEGYFVYATEAGGTICMALPDQLCHPCVVDADCLAPGSRCLVIDEASYCGRSCGPGSVYGPDCPAGYSCDAAQDAPQCLPTSGSCLCNPAQEGASRACTVESCTGFQYCQAQAGVWTWSDCDISYLSEICDAHDNNCDGQIDEGYLNPATGRYEADNHCGFCNNDCTVWWSPELHHASGACDTAPSFPTCRMTCLQETVGGVDYEWVDVNDDTLDGCECRRVSGNLTNDLPDLGTFPAPGAHYFDENCDGVDGVIDDALFVWVDHPGVGSGTRLDPFHSITEALVALPGAGKRYVLVAEGLYAESVQLTEGAQVYGGYASDFLGRDILLFTTTIQGIAAADVDLPGAVNAQGVGAGPGQTVLSGFHVQGRDVDDSAAENEDGAASCGLFLIDVGPGLLIQNNVIRGGRGGTGGRGAAGNVGYGRQVSAELDGQPGMTATRVEGECPAGLWRPGGVGGVNSQCSSGNGTQGGGATCPQFDWSVTPYVGGHAEYPSGSHRNGTGGADWSFDQWSSWSCSHVTESGWPSDPQRNVGVDGLDGNDSLSGSGGQACTAPHGSIRDGLWIEGDLGARNGGPGGTGQAGGGGGAGGGTARWFTGPDDCSAHEQAATGGGGGAGGCFGTGGLPGGQGGASIAVFVSYSAPTATAQLPSILENRIRRGPGGDGGEGGFGRPGGMGGLGGFGGMSSTWVGSLGGKGGDGGNGGPGGGGGGACGGPSYGVLGYNAQGASWSTTNTFDYDDSVDTGGAAGQGGGSHDASAVGQDGQPGASVNVLYLSTCAGGETCLAGQRCDYDDTCVPN